MEEARPPPASASARHPGSSTQAKSQLIPGFRMQAPLRALGPFLGSAAESPPPPWTPPPPALTELGLFQIWRLGDLENSLTSICKLTKAPTPHPSPAVWSSMGFTTLAQLGLGFGPTQTIYISGYLLSLCLQMVEKLFIFNASPVLVPAPRP